MTDEEGLEYAVQHVCLNCSELGKCDKGVHCEFLKIVRECYDDAIEIGRKEKQQVVDTQTVEIESRDIYLIEKENIIIRQQIEIQELEKENEELEKEIENYKLSENEGNEIIAELKAQIERLEEDKGQIIFESDLKIKALEEMIEKMKNVGNCKHSMKCAEWNEKQSYLGLMKFCLNCKDWELAE